MQLENFHIIKARAKADFKGNWFVLIRSDRFERTVKIPFISGLQVCEQASMYLQNKGFEMIGKGELKDNFILISSTFQDIK